MSEIKDPRGGRAWRKLRLQILAMSDVCWLCRRTRCLKGCCETANVVDHVKPFSTHPELGMEPTNLKPAHRCCNTAKGDRTIDARDPKTQAW